MSEFFHVAIHYIVALHNSMCYAAHQVARRPPTFLELLRAKHLRASRHLELCLCGFASVSPRSREPLLKMQWPSVKPCQKKTLLNQNQLPDPFRLRKGKAHLSLACRGCLDGCCFRSRTSNVCQLPGQQKRLACAHLMLQWKQLSPSQSLPPVAASRTVCLRDGPIETIRVGPSLKKNPSCQNDCQWWHKAKEKHLNTQDF